MASVRIERHDAVATLTLDRPEKLNAIDESLLRELFDGIAALEGDTSVRAAVLTGAGGKAFAAGADIASMAHLRPEDARRFAALGHRIGEAIELARFPVIAAVNGFALGGGCELAMACDFIYAAQRAKLGQPEVNLGIIPGFGGTQRLARRVGIGKARELCMTGAVVSAEEALRIGLVDAVLPDDQLMPKALETAAAIAAKAPLAVAAIKRATFRGQDVALAVANELEVASFAALFATEDQREGMQAFLEKRAPKFRGQ